MFIIILDRNECCQIDRVINGHKIDLSEQLHYLPDYIFNHVFFVERYESGCYVIECEGYQWWIPTYFVRSIHSDNFARPA